MAQFLNLLLKAEGSTPPKLEFSTKVASGTGLADQYKTLRSHDKKSDFLENLVSELKPSNINSARSKEIIAFLNQPEVKDDLERYAKTLLKDSAVIKRLSPEIKLKIEAFAGNKIEASKQNTLDATNGLVKSATELEQSNSSGKKVTHEEHRGHKRNFEARKEENEKNIKRHKELELKPNKTIQEEAEYQKLEKDIERFRAAYQKYKERANKSGVDTTDLDHLLVNLKIFQAKELFPVVQGRDFPITDISESSQNSSIGSDPSLQNSQTAKKLYETLNQLISDIRGSKVRELLADARKAIESEIKKIDEAKAEFRSELKKIEEGNATNKKELISALEKKLTEKVKGSLDAIKNKLLDVTKNLNIDNGSLEKAVNAVTQKLQNMPKNLSPEEKVNFQTNLVMTMMIALLDKAKEQNENEIQPNDVQKIKQTIEQKFDDIMKVASSSVNTPQSINKQNATASILNSLENGMTILKKEMRGITFDDSKIQSLKLKFPEKLSTLSSLGVIRSVAKEMTKDIEMMMSQGNVSEEAIKKTVDDLLKKVKEIFGEIKQGIKGDIIKAALKDLPELMNKLFKTEADENNTIDGVLKEFSMEMNKMFTEQKESQLA